MNATTIVTPDKKNVTEKDTTIKPSNSIPSAAKDEKTSKMNVTTVKPKSAALPVVQEEKISKDNVTNAKSINATTTRVPVILKESHKNITDKKPKNDTKTI